ncbi:MAG: small ribosomal subunit Rsm22 family protein, partial [Thermoleophilaceae bacterium]
PGSAAWAALATWPTIGEATLVDREGPMAELGRELAQRSGMASLAAGNWVHADLRTWTDTPRDLVTAGYLLGELDTVERDALTDRLWDMTRGLLLLVEPGTPDGFARIRAARARLIEAGASVVAPCPHDRECPMIAPDWCHFGVRLERSRLHRRAKGAELSYEDEPYSYVAASRDPNTERGARVLRRPMSRKGVIDLRLCTDAGIVERRVSRREGTAFKQARRLDWGSSVPQELDPSG